MREFRITRSTERVLDAFLQAPDEGTYGYDLAKASGISPGSVYPILARLENVGWIESHWEQPDPGNEERPLRRRYQLTTDGREFAGASHLQMLRERAGRLASHPPLRRPETA
jgi:PadR family transcriptional regulator PadR